MQRFGSSSFAKTEALTFSALKHSTQQPASSALALRASAGACHHAVGEFIEAVANYERAFSMEVPELGDDARSRQFLSFYQREMALYTLNRLDEPIAEYCLDRDLHPIFKVCAIRGSQILASLVHP